MSPEKTFTTDYHHRRQFEEEDYRLLTHDLKLYMSNRLNFLCKQLRMMSTRFISAVLQVVQGHNTHIWNHINSSVFTTGQCQKCEQSKQHNNLLH